MSDLLARYDAGESYAAIAEAVGVSRSAAQRTIKRALEAAGRPTRRTHQWTREDVAKLVAWQRDGLSFAEIGRRLGVSEAAAKARWAGWRNPC